MFHFSVLYVIYIVLLWVPAEKGPVGLVQPDHCPLGYIELQGGKENFFLENSLRRDSLLSMLWNKELRRYMGDLEACRTAEIGQGKVMYLSFKVTDCKLYLSRQPNMTVSLQQPMKKLHSFCIEQL